MVAEVAPLVGDGAGLKAPLLLYLSHDGDPQRTAVGPALAAAAEAAGWGFECYYDAYRGGRHFGGGSPDEAAPGAATGSLVAAGRHLERAALLATRFEVVALGDPDCVLWPALEAAAAEELARTIEPGELYETAFARLRQPMPKSVLVLDAAPQGPRRMVTAPYLYPEFLGGEPRLGLDVSSGPEVRERLERIGASEFRGLYVDSDRARRFPGGLSVEGEVGDDDYAALTAGLAGRHADWGRGVLLGDPALVAAQLPKARRLRLLPLYGRPQTDVVERAEQVVRAAREPVFGRQYDDRDFFTLARLGHGLQVLDPDPPFDASAGLPVPLRAPPVALAETEPDDAELERWSTEGRVLVSLLFWCGMVRECHCLPAILDLIAVTGLRIGLVLTAEVVEHADPALLALLAAPVERGGAFGLVEPLLASTGRGVAAESLLPEGTLAASLAEARTAVATRLPPELEPRGWWPLLDAPLVPSRPSRVARRGSRPVIRFTPRSGSPAEDSAGPAPVEGRDARRLAGSLVRSLGLERLFEERRPFDDRRPGAIDESVAGAVHGAGFEYMWTKAAFGQTTAALNQGGFVALPFTAGNWDGWSPFYTVAGTRDLVRAERRLLRRRAAGWLAGTIDSPLWLLPGELLERGSVLYRIAELAAAGGRSGKLVNVTPNVIARYARMLDARGFSGRSRSPSP